MTAGGSQVGIVGVASHLPSDVVDREYFERYSRPDDPLLRNPMFRAPRSRRYAKRGQTGAELIAAAAGDLARTVGEDAVREVDMVISHIALPDVPFVGSGAEIARLLGARPARIVDLHNGHCAVLPVMLDLVCPMLAAGQVRTALLCVAQNSGRVFTQPGVRTSAHAAIPGDGAAVVLVAATEDGGVAPVLGTHVLHRPEYAPDVSITLGAQNRLYWEPGTEELDVYFDNFKAQNIIERGSALVPEAVTAACTAAGVRTSEIDTLITNQPNRLLLRNWSKALGVDPARHPDTYDSYGNLFGAGIPVTLEQAARDGALADGSLVLVGGFAGAGELAAAAAIRWNTQVLVGRSGPGPTRKGRTS
nr:3-oxoacyl-[acyl-carrier-protein] synthase III C-terminal domain-containing protein [Kibdelosporangium sp. MJ126-NF4]CEL14732.1 3-oxoacyl-[acyl-carrier-protein] synthase, KASIII [Kibdelosporangium sp. MJ126-NF4]CTQ96638.1 3-oxoacyl-[acyl-carrier-protein] synthase, KASIII (EC 2.3.1.41) [Kibdelosporangium sp. MJ126-NF4]